MAGIEGIYLRMPGISLEEATAIMGRYWGWLLAVGIAYVGVGVGALMLPVESSYGLTLFIGAILVATGIIELIQAIKLRHEQGGLMRFFQSILAIAAGAAILFYPRIGLYGISLVLSFYFFIGAAMQWILARVLAPARARIWVYLSSAASFLLGFYIVFTFPISAFWVPGTLLGIEFIFSGTGLIGLALVIRRLFRESKGMTGSTFWQATHQPT